MRFVRFGLIVTGRGEAEFMPQFFRSLMGAANCTFEVIRKSEQLSPITSPRRTLKMAGRKGRIPTIDEEQFGLPALDFLRRHPDGYVLVIDDLEGARRERVIDVFSRYRAALDSVIGATDLSGRAAVHFLVNMLEAYYFAHVDAVNTVAKTLILHEPPVDDVESIGHPKNMLKKLWNGFNEIQHGGEIIGLLDLNVVLDRPNACCWLRNLFAWCIVRLVACGSVWDQHIEQRFQLPTGMRAIVTGRQ